MEGAGRAVEGAARTRSTAPGRCPQATPPPALPLPHLARVQGHGLGDDAAPALLKRLFHYRIVGAGRAAANDKGVGQGQAVHLDREGGAQYWDTIFQRHGGLPLQASGVPRRDPHPWWVGEGRVRGECRASAGGEGGQGGQPWDRSQPKPKAHASVQALSQGSPPPLTSHSARKRGPSRGGEGAGCPLTAGEWLGLPHVLLMQGLQMRGKPSLWALSLVHRRNGRASFLFCSGHDARCQVSLQKGRGGKQPPYRWPAKRFFLAP